MDKVGVVNGKSQNIHIHLVGKMCFVYGKSYNLHLVHKVVVIFIWQKFELTICGLWQKLQLTDCGEGWCHLYMAKIKINTLWFISNLYSLWGKLVCTYTMA